MKLIRFCAPFVSGVTFSFRPAFMSKQKPISFRMFRPYAYHLVAAMTIYLVLAFKQKRSQRKM